MSAPWVIVIGAGTVLLVGGLALPARGQESEHASEEGERAPSKQEKEGPPRSSATHRAEAGGIAPSEPEDPSGEEQRAPSPFLAGAMLEPALLLGETANYAGNLGILGFGLDVRYLGLSPWCFGAGIGWHSVSETSPDSFAIGETVYTGTTLRELSFTPILAKVGYSFLTGASKPNASPAKAGTGESSAKPKPVPYVTLGVGGIRAARRMDVGILSTQEEVWHFALAPEVGVEMPLGPVILLGAARLNLLLPSGDEGFQSYANVGLGLGFR